MRSRVCDNITYGECKVGWFNSAVKLLKQRFKAPLPQSNYAFMHTFLTAGRVDKKQPMADLSLLVVDLEMTGLTAANNQIVSIGWVRIENLQIVHASARHVFINNTAVNLDESAPIHKISHQQLATGEPQEVALQALLEALTGKVLVLHHAPIDMRFLNALSQQLYGVKLKPQIIDTMEIERRRLSLKGQLQTSSLRLNECRKRYNLPQYDAHNAAVDALATAELLLAQVAYGGEGALTNYVR